MKRRGFLCALAVTVISPVARPALGSPGPVAVLGPGDINVGDVFTFGDDPLRWIVTGVCESDGAIDIRLENP